MRLYMYENQIALSAIGLALFLGCERQLPSPNATSETPSNVSVDDVKRDVSTSMATTAAYSQQEKDKLLADMQAQLAEMDAKIEKLRLQGRELASDAKTRWEMQMATLDEKRKLANERLAEFGESTSKAWSDVAKGAKSAWEDLAKAFQDASSEF
jgi:TolA-binding protein